MEQPLPQVLALGYEIQRVLGHGGMGTVYLARQASLDRVVALKILHAHRSKIPTAVASFLKEASSAAQLNHPNLASVHDVHADEVRGLYCYAMEYVEGCTAAQHIARHGPFPCDAALNIILQIGKALAYAHRSGLVHRDVKPDNIMISTTSEAKLLDLGLVHDRVLNPGDQKRILTIVGTLEYSAPEQHRNPANAVPASDIYSLGVTLFVLLTGKLPFQGQTVIDLIVRVATDPVIYPAAIPPQCQTLLNLMLTKNPHDRLQNGDALVDILRKMAAGEPPRNPQVRGLPSERNPALIPKSDAAKHGHTHPGDALEPNHEAHEKNLRVARPRRRLRLR